MTSKKVFDTKLGIGVTKRDNEMLSKIQAESGLSKAEIIRYLIWSFENLYESKPDDAIRMLRSGVLGMKLK